MKIAQSKIVLSTHAAASVGNSLQYFVATTHQTVAYEIARRTATELVR
jgi:hypothetical protein